MPTAKMADEVAMIRRYRIELDSIEKQMRKLNGLRTAMSNTVQGLEQILKANGVDPNGLDGEDNAESSGATPESKTLNVLSATVAALRRLGSTVGAKDLQRVMAEAGIQVNYYTLYKNLGREAAREDGLVMRVGDKYGLREWATTDPSQLGDS